MLLLICGASFGQNSQGTGIVSAAKAYYYKEVDTLTKRKAFNVKGDKVKYSQLKGDFAYVYYTNDKGIVTQGWMLISVLTLQPPVEGNLVMSEQGKNPVSHTPSNSAVKRVTIGSQEWAPANLNVGTFRNGDTIPEAESMQEWVNAGNKGTPAWCYYNGDTTNGNKYGRLYNWNAVHDSRGLAPQGWNIPTDDDWTVLFNYLCVNNDIGLKMKSISGWANNGNGDNSSGFSASPAGCRSNNGNFVFIGGDGYWWSGSEYGNDAFNRHINYGNSDCLPSHNNKGCGFSVRCIKRAVIGNTQTQSSLTQSSKVESSDATSTKVYQFNSCTTNTGTIKSSENVKADFTITLQYDKDNKLIKIKVVSIQGTATYFIAKTPAPNWPYDLDVYGHIENDQGTKIVFEFKHKTKGMTGEQFIITEKDVDGYLLSDGTKEHNLILSNDN